MQMQVSGRYLSLKNLLDSQPSGDIASTDYRSGYHQRLNTSRDVCPSEILTGIPGVVCMMDDILVYGATLEEHDKHLREVLQRLQKAGMTLNREKCQFAQTSVRFLGHVIDSAGVRPDPDKIQAIEEFQQPKNVGDVRHYLGMVNHLSKFAPVKSKASFSI